MSESVFQQFPQQPLPDSSVGQEITVIDMLPDNVLLEIFGCYREDNICLMFSGFRTWTWKTLAQVCRRWRCIVFTSPRRLGLFVVCSNKTPTRTSLDIWPPFPIAIVCDPPPSGTVDEKGLENVIAGVERRDRISDIYITDIPGTALEQLAAAMQEPFPALMHFHLASTDRSVPVLSETFLGGSAPCLQSFHLSGIPFPAFPRFNLSVSHIVHLHLLNIPNSGYISPREMATCLAALPGLISLSIGFQSPLSPPPQSSLPPPMRTILPALTHLHLSGVSEYFEDFVARIDTPLLNQLFVTFFMDLIFDIPRLHDFISRTKSLWPFNQAGMEISGPAISMTSGSFELKIKCETVIDDADIRPAIAHPFSRRTVRDLRVSLGVRRAAGRPGRRPLAVVGTFPPV